MQRVLDPSNIIPGVTPRFQLELFLRDSRKVIAVADLRTNARTSLFEPEITGDPKFMMSGTITWVFKLTMTSRDTLPRNQLLQFRVSCIDDEFKHLDLLAETPAFRCISKANVKP